MSNAALALEGRGLVLGRYRPLRPLGTGGSGTVWLARDEQNGLDVALKIVAREGKAAQRAEREAQAAAKLRHPSCLRAYAFARDARHVYIAYEFVPGRTFREAMRAGELDDASAIEACAQICDGLAHAHRAGILHRDVKPSNVLLADGDRMSARLLDFGLARMAEAETLTAQGDVPGTLAYIAPERLAGENATEAADVWSVGVMLWEALAGRHPFWQTSMLETARAIEAGAPPLAELRPDLPKGMLQLVDRSLSPHPSRRPSAAAFAASLRGAAAPRRRKRSRGGGTAATLDVAVPAQAGRFAAAALAGLFAGGATALMPFFPNGWPIGIAVAAAAASLYRERLGLAVALVAPVLPLGNVSLGLAVVYAGLAVLWLALFWKEPRGGLLFVLGAPAAAVSLLPLFPLATLGLRAWHRRAAQAVAAVLVAALVAGVRHTGLPLTGARAPLGMGVTGAGDPFDVAGSIVRAAGAQPRLLLEAAALATVAALLPAAIARGRWGAAGLGALMLAATLIPVPGAAALPLVLAAWITAAVVALRAGT